VPTIDKELEVSMSNEEGIGDFGLRERIYVG
jgi:hypothetical protein